MKLFAQKYVNNKTDIYTSGFIILVASIDTKLTLTSITFFLLNGISKI
jgi:hypothetical protein